MANLGDDAARGRSNRSISIHITAEDGADLRRQLLNMLGMYAVDTFITPYQPVAMPDATIVTSKDDDRRDWNPVRDKTAEESEAIGRPVEREEPEEAPKRRPHRRTRPAAPVATPAPVEEEEVKVDLLEPDEEVDRYERGDYDMTPAEVAADRNRTPEPGPDYGPNGDAHDDEVEKRTQDAIGNEKLKTAVISRLQDMFTAGKVKTIRYVLDHYGDGAKSFPEIDAARFPAIDEALRRGEGA